jgi:hypothetical protein
LGKPKGIATPGGFATVSISYSNIYHSCLSKLLEDCAEENGECAGCPVSSPCAMWWDRMSEHNTCGTNCYKVTSENFPYLVLQFLKFREKVREKSRTILRTNHIIYRKELVSKGTIT